MISVQTWTLTLEIAKLGHRPLIMPSARGLDALPIGSVVLPCVGVKGLATLQSGTGRRHFLFCFVISLPLSCAVTSLQDCL